MEEMHRVRCGKRAWSFYAHCSTLPEPPCVHQPRSSLSLLLEREKGRQRNINVRNIDQLSPICALTGETDNLGMCHDQELNPQPFSYRKTLQPAEPRLSGPEAIFKEIMTETQTH